MLICRRCQNQFDRSKHDIKRGRTGFCSRICADLYKVEQARRRAAAVKRTGKKQCKMCNATKPITEFHKASTLDGYSWYCGPCKVEANRRSLQKQRSRNREQFLLQRRRNHLIAKYGLTLEEYDDLLAQQKGVCAICKRGNGAKFLVVDHRHKGEVVRGLLCDGCNIGLGMFRDNPAILRVAAAYLTY